MGGINPTDWRPTALRRVVHSKDTSMGTTEIVTDAGWAYIKPMGNRQGPHALAAEWVGTHLARWLGLPTFDFAIMELGDADTFPLPRKAAAQAGPAFVTRAMKGKPWSGDPAVLSKLVNPDDVSKLVVFDTWTLNCDRHPPDLSKRKPNRDNVYLSTENAPRHRLRLVAMDHTHCFTCGRDLTGNVATIDRVRSDEIYGLFPEFVCLLRADVIAEGAVRLRAMKKGIAENATGLSDASVSSRRH